MKVQTTALSIAAYVFTALMLSSCESTENTAEQGSGQANEPQTDSVDFYFSTNRFGNYEILRRNVENGVLFQEFITLDSNFDSWWPRQSPDGKTMLFYRSRIADRPESGGHNNNYDNAALWSLDLQNGELVEIIPKGANGWKAQGVVDWSPDSTTLIMAAIEGSSNRWHLYTTNADGANPVRISSRSSLFLDPSWSPDGSQIVYAAFPPDYNGSDTARLEIYIADSNGQNEQRLTNDNLRDHDPYWSPDGSTIAFETSVDPLFLGVGKWALRSVNLITSQITTVFDDGNINTLPRWSENGDFFYFHRFIFGSSHGFILAAINTDGSNYREITAGGNYDDTDIDWYRPIANE